MIDSQIASRLRLTQHHPDTRSLNRYEHTEIDPRRDAVWGRHFVGGIISTVLNITMNCLSSTVIKPLPLLG